MPIIYIQYITNLKKNYIAGSFTQVHWSKQSMDILFLGKWQITLQLQKGCNALEEE